MSSGLFDPESAINGIAVGEPEWPADDPGPPEPPPPGVDGYDVPQYRRNGHRVGQPGDEPTSWDAIDLNPYLRGEIARQNPSLGISRSDGQKLIYQGREHSALGETESGKTWFAIACVAAELNAGRYVVYVHYEESDPASTVERLLLLGVDRVIIASRLRFVAPSRPVQGEWLEPLLDPPPALVVHDGVNEAMALHGADIMAAEGAASFRRRLIMPCLRAGAATLSCDHLPKAARDHGGRRDAAYGSVHKGNTIDGARILLENVEPFGRGLRGRSYVFITKDRPGSLRARGKPTKLPGTTFMGTLVVDDSETLSPDFGLKFFAPRADDNALVAAGDDPVAGLAESVHQVIVAVPPDQSVASMRQLFAEMRKAGHQVRNETIRDAVDDLLVSGRLVEVPGKRNALGYRAIATTASRGETQSEPTASATASASPYKGRGTQSQGNASEAVGRNRTQS